MTRTISCDRCSEPYQTKRSNTKRCRGSAVYQELGYMNKNGLHKVRCERCKEPFARTDQKTDFLCASCDMQAQLRLHPGACSICRRQNKNWRPDLAVCLWCAKDLKHRRTLIARLSSRMIANRQANGYGAA